VAQNPVILFTSWEVCGEVDGAGLEKVLKNGSFIVSVSFHLDFQKHHKRIEVKNGILRRVSKGNN
jgi:hypothetical protein